MAERIRSAFADAAAEVEGRPVKATISIGMVMSQEASLELPKLLAHADQALYVAKERGRNRIEVATPDMVVKRKDAPAKSAVVEAAQTAA